MIFALLTDIHGNREAFDACRAEALRLGALRFAYLGDIVGYGADPCYVVDSISEDVSRGAISVQGNHDLAAVRTTERRMNSYAQAAIEWTARRLDAAQSAFLADMPLLKSHVGVAGTETMFVHGDASAPEKFIYVTSAAAAERSLNAVTAHVTFCGHVHRPQLYHMAPGKPAVPFRPTPGLPTPLARSRRWFCVLGSVGQPRDGDPRAAFALYDDTRGTLTHHRIAYDVETAAKKIERAGLPEFLAQRLFLGR